MKSTCLLRPRRCFARRIDGGCGTRASVPGVRGPGSPSTCTSSNTPNLLTAWTGSAPMWCASTRRRHTNSRSGVLPCFNATACITCGSATGASTTAVGTHGPTMGSTGRAAATEDPGSPPQLSVVAPVYKSEAIVPEFVHRVCAAASKTTRDFELLLIEDGGPDDSWAAIVHECQQDPRVKGIQLSRNFGQQ